MSDNQPQKPSVMRVALDYRLRLVLEFGLEEKNRIDLGPHEHGTWRRKPSIEPLGPGLVQCSRARSKCAPDGQIERARGKIRDTNGGCCTFRSHLELAIVGQRQPQSDEDKNTA